LLNVAERFYSIQGESTRAGLPCLFIRLAGCNLRCSYCDSGYTWKEPGKQTTLKEIVEWTEGFPGVMVELTGGEPLLQDEVYPLMETLLEKSRTVLVETNGSISIDRVPGAATVILDIKCPDSGMDSTIDWDNVERLFIRTGNGSSDEVKFVLSSEKDFHWARGIVEQYGLSRTVPVLFSPVSASLEPRELAELILSHNMTVRLQLQLHKILWPEFDRGV